MKHRLLDLVFSLLFLASCANAQVNITEEELTRIIGGSEAVEDRYSYAVYLQSSDGYMCGGSLIARDVVLTAAHCMNATDYGVAVVGSHNIIYDVDGEVLIVREVMPHPNFNPMFMKFGFLDYDIMLVFLDGASTANHVVTVKLNSDPSLPTVGQSLTVMGWGDTDARPGLDFQVTSHVLMNVDVIAISNEECEASEGYNDDGLYFSYDGKITDNMLCTEADGKDSCQGDSGGPLVIKGDDGSADVQVGVVSWAMGCALAQFPGVNTRVSQAYDWIRSEVCKGSDYASEAGFDCSINNDDDVSSTPPIIQPTSPPILAPTGGISTNDNPCIICPNGADEGFDDFAPNAVLGDPTTCAELIDDATLFETGSEDCAAAKMIKLSCCYTAPENPCTICPNGVTERDDYVPPYEGNTFTCAENIDYATQFETESDYCGVFGVLDESYCCPPVNDGSSTPPIIQPTSPSILAPTGVISTNDNTCIICPNGADEGFDDFTPNAVFGDPTTCAELINYATLFETETDTCGWFEIYEAFCCFTVPENPCIICPDGITEGYDDYAPYVDFGDAATCAELIDFATLFETESDYCGLIGEFDASYCCSSLDTTATAVDPCIICPNGATAGDEYSLYAATGDPTTCAELIDYAMLFETGSADCAAAEAYELLCCLTVPENPCTICPNGTTEGFDDYVPFADEGNISTCAENIDYAALFETESDYCGLVAEVIKLSCCYTAPGNPCTICPNGATAGDDYVPEYEGNIWTCAELINEAVQYESGSDYCGLLGEEIKSYCCPYVTITPMTTPTTPNTSTAPPATDPPTVAEMTPAPTPMQTEETTDASSLGTTAMNPCIICPNGATAGDDFAPWANDGDFTTCAEHIDYATLFETGSEDCAWAEEYELLCCLTVPENPCTICPNGATAGDDYVPPYEGNTFTCAEDIDYAALFETESDYCGLFGEEIKSYCCPPETSAPTPVPVDNTTVATTTTSSTNVAPSPVEPLTTSPSSSTTTKSPTVSSSGCASVAELVFTFIVLVSSLCVIAFV